MLCTEAQDLIRAGRTRYLECRGLDAVRDEVDEHVRGCQACQEVVIEERRRRFRAIFSPAARLRTSRLIKELRTSPLEDATQRAHDPLQRVVNVILKVAVTEGACQVALHPIERQLAEVTPDMTVERIDTPSDPRTEALMTEVAPATIQAFKAHLAAIDTQTEPSVSVDVLFCVEGRWSERMSLPGYIRESLTARIKSMANLLVAVTNKVQEGDIPARIEQQNYDVNVAVTPGEHGEHLLLDIRPAASQPASNPSQTESI